MNVLQNSRLICTASVAVALLRSIVGAIWAPIEHALLLRASPVDGRDLAALLATSRLMQWSDGLISRLDAAVTGSMLLRDAHSWLAVGDPADAVGLAGLTAAIASTVHLVLLFFEPYTFPSRAAIWLPLVVLAVGLAGVVCRQSLAAALIDRRARRKTPA